MYKSLCSIVLTLAFVQAQDSTLRGAKGSKASSILGSGNYRRELQVSVSGECTVSNFAAAVGGTSALASLLGSAEDDTAMQSILDTKCADALVPEIDLVDTLGEGPQFFKNYIDGASSWNDHYEEDDNYKLSEDAAVIPTVDAKTTVFAAPDGGTSAYYPKYFSNFYHIGGEECPLGVITCCYTSSREEATKPFVGNAEMCALDMTGAAKSNHIKAKSMTFYASEAANQAYCAGFAYEDGSFGDAVKYNTFFHLAMETNLYEKALVKNVPGAPLCGCAEQMPIVDNADCVEPVEGYTIDSNGDVKVNITWKSCGTDLATYYDSLDRTDMEKYFVKKQIVGSGNCPAAADSFMNDRMYIPASE